MAQAVTIPANDLKRPFELHADAYEQKALEVLRSGWYILGKEVSAFEQAFCRLSGSALLRGACQRAGFAVDGVSAAGYRAGGMRSSSARTHTSPA